MKFVSLNHQHKEDWNKLLKGHKHNSIFQSYDMFRVLSKLDNLSPFAFGVYNNDSLAGLISGIIYKDFFWPLSLFTTRSVIHGPPIIENDDSEILNFLLSKYDQFVKKKAIYTQVRNLYEIKNLKTDFLRNNYKYEKHLDIIHNISQPEDVQFNKIHKGRRKNIRRAEKIGLVFREINHAKEFDLSVNLLIDTYKRIKLPLPDKSYFKHIYTSLKQEYLKVFILEFQDEIIATRLVLCYNKTIYDWYAGTSQAHLDKYPNDFLPWKIFQWGKINGYNLFDFGGAGKPNIKYGVRDYKLKFGGDLVEYGRFEKIHNRLLYNIGKIGFTILNKL